MDFKQETINAINEYKDFNNIVSKRLDSINTVLCKKAREYATNDDRFHNFTVAGRVMGCTPEKALEGMMMKHYVSVMDIINKAESLEAYDIQLINEKIGDMINYLILLEGLLKTRIANKDLLEIDAMSINGVANA